VGAAFGAVGSSMLLAPGVLPPDMGWRWAFGIGAALGLVILFLRRLLPESPRWLLLHGRKEEAEAIVRAVQGGTRGAGRTQRLHLRPRPSSFIDLGRSLFRLYPRRAILGLVLMASQAFCYNAIFFTYALVLGRFYGIASDRVGLYLLPFAVGNFLGPLLLGRLFDTLGRRPMIAGTYGLAGLLLGLTAILFVAGKLDAVSQTFAWTVVFFFASAAASSAYLTVGECFPLEVRALSIAFFYAFGTAIGGVMAPWLFGILVGTGEPAAVASGYALGAILMLVAAGVALWLGVDAECKPLEEVARPLSSADSS